jgi:hypothetical protein
LVHFVSGEAVCGGVDCGGSLGRALGEFVPLGVVLPSGATVSPYLSLLSPGGVALVPCVALESPMLVWPELPMLLWFELLLGEFVPLGAVLPSGATVSPYLSLLSPGGVVLVPCVDWAITMLHDSSAMEAKQMRFFILILLALFRMRCIPDVMFQKKLDADLPLASWRTTPQSFL